MIRKKQANYNYDSEIKIIVIRRIIEFTVKVGTQ